MRDFKTYLAGQLGEFLVAAELSRRGIVAVLPSVNMPEYDIFAFRGEKTIPLQVKTVRSTTLQIKITDYLEIDFDGPKQIIRGLRPIQSPDRIMVVVFAGQDIRSDRIYILRYSDLQQIAHAEHASYLAKHAGVRPRNPRSLHCGLRESLLHGFRDNWDLIEGALG